MYKVPHTHTHTLTFHNKVALYKLYNLTGMSEWVCQYNQAKCKYTAYVQSGQVCGVGV